MTRRVLVGCIRTAVWVATCAPTLWSQTTCASTPANAVLRELGLSAASSVDGGFRVKDVVFDNVLRRSFVRVEQCGHAERPLTLLPLGSMAQGEPGPLVSASRSSAVESSRVTPPQTIAMVQAGTTVAVTMLDARAQVLLRGRLLNSAAVGSSVEVEIASLSGDAPPRHLRGRLSTADTVEVLP